MDGTKVETTDGQLARTKVDDLADKKAECSAAWKGPQKELH